MSGKAEDMRPGNKNTARGSARAVPDLGQRKGPESPLTEGGRKYAGGVTGLEQSNALARRLPTA